jgi:hypothetical protein
MPELETALQWRGQNMYDRDGDKIGRIEEIYLDQETDLPEWALVHTGLLGTKSTFVPIASATPTDEGVRVPFEKAQVKDAPNIDPDGELSRRHEEELYAYYGMDYGDSRSTSGMAEGEGGAADAPVERDASEASDRERGPDAGTAPAESQPQRGDARLRRYGT